MVAAVTAMPDLSKNSLLDDGAITPSYLAPSSIQIVPPLGKGHLCGCFLVDLNSPPRLLAYPQVSIFHLGAAMKDLPRPLIERCVFLDAKVVADEVQRDVGHVTDRGDISGAVPRRSNSKLLGQDCDLTRPRESANLRKMDPDVVDQSLGNQRLPFMWIIEKLAHRAGCGAVLADLPEVSQILRREGICKKEHFELFCVLAELHGLIRQQPFMHVVEQFD